MKISGHLWKGLNIAEHLWISVNITENVWKLLWTSMKISGHLWKCLNITKTSENYCFNYETVWKPLLALFIAKWSSTYVLSTFYELHLRKTPEEKEKELAKRTKLNTRQAKIYNRASILLLLTLFPKWI